VTGFEKPVRILNQSPICKHIKAAAKNLILTAVFFIELTLPLLVLRVTANYAHNTVALDNFTVTADFLHGSTNFHCYTP
jgi:hypothetical protein